MESVVSDGTVATVNHETGASAGSWMDLLLIPFFQGMLKVTHLVQAFSPVDALSTGRTITWGTLGVAFLKIVLVLGGLFALAGIWCFTRRELATAQGDS